jgi:hypothetical protein
MKPRWTLPTRRLVAVAVSRLVRRLFGCRHKHRETVIDGMAQPIQRYCDKCHKYQTRRNADDEWQDGRWIPVSPQNVDVEARRE